MRAVARYRVGARPRVDSRGAGPDLRTATHRGRSDHPLDDRGGPGVARLSAGRADRHPRRARGGPAGRHRRHGPRLAAGGPRRPGLRGDRLGRAPRHACSSSRRSAGSSGSWRRRARRPCCRRCEAAYPWLLALTGTCLFAGLGLARRTPRARLSPPAEAHPRARPRRRSWRSSPARPSPARRSPTSSPCAIDRPSSSRFGPTDPERVPPPCDGPLRAGTTAQVQLDLSADIDQHPIGSATVAGSRSGTDVRVAGRRRHRPGPRAVRRRPDRRSRLAAQPGGRLGVVRSGDGRAVHPRPAGRGDGPDRADRTAAEDRGIEFIEGARARHCRIAIDGPTFEAAFPEIVWFADARPDVHRWRGELDYWIFARRRGRADVGGVNGDAAGIGADGLQGTIRATMIATDRDRPVSIAPPTG